MKKKYENEKKEKIELKTKQNCTPRNRKKGKRTPPPQPPVKPRTPDTHREAVQRGADHHNTLVPGHHQSLDLHKTIVLRETIWWTKSGP